MADLGWVTRATGERHRVQASDLPTGRFDELRKAIQRKEAVLRCVNEQCRGGMHCRRWGAMQLFAHNPGTLETCPERRGESETHKALKEHIAWIGETRLGLRAEVEQPFAGLKPDVQLYRPDKPHDYGPVFCVEIQNSPIDLASFDERDARLNEACGELAANQGVYERRAVPWIFTFTPAFAGQRAHLQIDREDGDTIISGLYDQSDPDGDCIEAPISDVLEQMAQGGIYRISDGASWSAWVRQAGTLRGAPRAPRRAARRRLASSRGSEACTRATTYESPGPGHHRTHLGRGFAGWVPDLCPECQDDDRRVRMHIDTDRWIYCGFCGWEPGRKELA